MGLSPTCARAPCGQPSGKRIITIWRRSRARPRQPPAAPRPHPALPGDCDNCASMPGGRQRWQRLTRCGTRGVALGCRGVFRCGGRTGARKERRAGYVPQTARPTICVMSFRVVGYCSVDFTEHSRRIVEWRLPTFRKYSQPVARPGRRDARSKFFPIGLVRETMDLRRNEIAAPDARSHCPRHGFHAHDAG